VLSLADPLLALSADVLDDLEKVRIANGNRLGQLTRTGADKDGEERGFGLTLDHPDVARLAALVEDLAKAEHRAELHLGRIMRRHPLWPWIDAQRGLGIKQMPRLLAAIGDPYWNDLHNRPRTVSELWAYCGYHTLRTGGGHEEVDTQAPYVAPRRVRGQRANWSTDAKMRAHLVAVSCMKAMGGHYREVYEKARAQYDGTLHPTLCVRCGPAGSPAPVGSSRSDGHLHAMALRRVAKEVLRDLWREAKRLHEDAA
jgi:hypothetical protein